jgi:methylenetetrahydrofolate dehydrogenase (NADP+) / methenyltetrahydrofolate cyclohydrolase
MLVDGKEIAENIFLSLERILAKESKDISLGIVYVGNDKVIDNFILIKKRFAERLGIKVEIYRFPIDVGQEELEVEISDIVKSHHDGLVVQLPLPQHLDASRIIDLVPLDKDVDVLSPASLEFRLKEGGEILPPVAGAVNEIFLHHGVSLIDKKVLVVGQGKLVGAPVLAWLSTQGVMPTVLRKGEDIAKEALQADIIISGVGSPGLIKPDIIKKGVILIDAGTSEVSGKMRGDVDPACYEVSSLATPVPGGVGPITIAVLIRNLVLLSNLR